MIIEKVPEECRIGRAPVVIVKNMLTIAGSSSRVGINHDDEVVIVNVVLDCTGKRPPPGFTCITISTTVGCMGRKEP